MERLLDVNGLTVKVGERTILRDISLGVAPGECAAMFGPNGSGKSTLLGAIMGIPGYEVVEGSVHFKGREVTGLGMDERARLGMGIMFQRPPVVRGVRLGGVMDDCLRRGGLGRGDIEEAVVALGFGEFMERELNLGLSGGEIKRSELLQLMAQRPDFLMLDEPDSGVDLVSINLLGRLINSMLEKDLPVVQRRRGGLVISHSGYVLDYINADRAYVMLKGRLYCSGNPRDLMADIRSRGYEGCATCRC